MTLSPPRSEVAPATAARALNRPGLATPRPAPVKAWLAERLFRRTVRGLPVRAVLPDGEVLGAGGPESPVMRIVRPGTFFHRLGLDAKIGFGEAYMAGDWTSADLADLLAPFAEHVTTLVPRSLQPLRRWVDAARPDDERNTVAGARDNIHRHYDLSNTMFEAFLDDSMTYSAALFASGSDDLPDAQQRKIDSVLDLADVTAGTHVLEIGTGWGALAIAAARRGARVTTLTISSEQKAFAQRQIAEAGVADRVQVLLRDYREANGTYDAVVSVEMIEAVGDEYWPAYFGTIARLLRPGGRVGLQAITMPHDRMLATRRSYTWIHKYVFPGGQLLSVPAVYGNAHAAGLEVTERFGFGQHYARTLRHWRERFVTGADRVCAAGFDPVFLRMWEFYLAYCEAGFRAGYLDVWQFGMTLRGTK